MLFSLHTCVFSNSCFFKFSKSCFSGASALSEPSSPPQAAPVVNLLRAATSQPPRGDSAEVMGAPIPQSSFKVPHLAVSTPLCASNNKADQRVWTGDSARSDTNVVDQQLSSAVKPPALTYVIGKNNVPKPVASRAATTKSRGVCSLCFV